ncbi:MAG: hypothetical protein ABH846_01955 [Patescibacteria group bacterium]
MEIPMRPTALFDHLQNGEFYIFDCVTGDFFRAASHFDRIVGADVDPPDPLPTMDLAEVSSEHIRYLASMALVASRSKQRSDSPYWIAFEGWQKVSYFKNYQTPSAPDEVPQEYLDVIYLVEQMSNFLGGIFDFEFRLVGITDVAGKRLLNLEAWIQKSTDERYEIPVNTIIDEANRAFIMVFKVELDQGAIIYDFPPRITAEA